MEIITLAELYDFCSSRKEKIEFSSKDVGKSIAVRVDEKLVFEEGDYDPDEGKFFVKIKAAHLFENVNNTYISRESMEKALPSFKGRPILAYIHEFDGEDDFAGHEYYIEDEKEVYEEVSVGHTLDNSEVELIDDEENGKTYAWVDGVLYEDYTKAPDIVRRKEGTDVSVELIVKAMSYDPDTLILNIEEFYVQGITLLGVDRESGKKIDPGMEGASLSFSECVMGDEPVIDKEKGGNPEMAKENFSGIKELLEKAQSVVNATYDNWYSVNVYPDDQKVTMYDYDTCKTFRQGYTYEEDVFALVGEREELFVQYLTEEEIGELEKLRTANQNFEAEIEAVKVENERLNGELAKYTEEPEKISVMESEEYACIADTEEFAALKEFDAHCEYSVEELKEKCDAMLLDYAKANFSKFSKNEEPIEATTPVVGFAATEAKASFLDSLLEK